MATAVLSQQPLHRRAAVMAGVVAVHLLLIWMLLHLAGYDRPRPLPGGPTTVTLLPDAADETQTTRARQRTEQREARRAERQAPDAPPVQPTPEVDVSAASEAAAIWQKVVPLSRAELAAADIARTPAASGAARGDGDAARSAGAAGGGGGQTGPNGETLYDAEWQRRPTDAELNPYLPSNRQPGWGLVACRTVSGNRVEDCVELGQSPAGSGLARAVRQAAWQFRVLPPRVGGRPQVGAWVRIRIDYTQAGG